LRCNGKPIRREDRNGNCLCAPANQAAVKAWASFAWSKSNLPSLKSARILRAAAKRSIAGDTSCT
jgi:hypothetical protein